MSDSLARVAEELGVRPEQIVTVKDVPRENGSWLLEDSGGGRVVVRRYHDGATPEDLAYEHAVLRHLAGQGWVVPEPTSELIRYDGLWYCLTRYVPGRAVAPETPDQRRRRAGRGHRLRADSCGLAAVRAGHRADLPSARGHRRNAWVVGDGATYTPRTLILHWNGHSWKRVASPNPHSWQASAS